MKNAEVKTQIQVEGAILTEEALSWLVSIQDQDNYGLNGNIDAIKDVIIWIVTLLDDISEEEAKNATEKMSSLIRVNRLLEGLRKP